jgi:ABC-type Mn2+/Zn2+ transport system ATPase subunit
VLRGVDLEFLPGSLTRVEGTNGSGKSTLLAIIAGIGRPSRGRVTGGGRTAYVPERLPSVLPFDVVGYLDRLGAVHGLTPQETRLRAAYWLEQLGAAAWANTPMATLSKGTAQKVALVQALMADVDVLVLDEAWSGLDPAARAVLDQAVNERVARGVAVVLVDHQQAGRADPDVDVLVIEGTSVRSACGGHLGEAGWRPPPRRREQRPGRLPPPRLPRRRRRRQGRRWQGRGWSRSSSRTPPGCGSCGSRPTPRTTSCAMCSPDRATMCDRSARSAR